MDSTQIRKWQRESFLECMQNYPPFNTLPSEYQKTIVRRLERGCHNANIEKSHKNHTPNYWDNPQFVEQYETICYNAKINLDAKSSVNQSAGPKTGIYLVSRVYNGAIAGYLLDSIDEITLPREFLLAAIHHLPIIPAENVGGINSIEMNPLISKKYIEEIALRGNQVIRKKYTTMHPCPKYGHRQATWRATQTRSGDEGNTHFLTCLVCCDRWRLY